MSDHQALADTGSSCFQESIYQTLLGISLTLSLQATRGTTGIGAGGLEAQRTQQPY